MIKLVERGLDIDGVTYYEREWRHDSGQVWKNTFRWDDLEGASWLPPTEDVHGLLFFCEGF